MSRSLSCLLVVPIGVRFEMKECGQNPITPNTISGEFPTIYRLNDLDYDSFMEHSIGMYSPKVANEILTYISNMAVLLRKEHPEIEECMLRMKLESLYPHTSSEYLICKAIEHRVIFRKNGANGQKLVSINK